MKLSKLIEHAQMRIAEYGDSEACIVRQTGPDSWIIEPITAIKPPEKVEGMRKPIFIVE